MKSLCWSLLPILASFAISTELAAASADTWVCRSADSRQPVKVSVRWGNLGSPAYDIPIDPRRTRIAATVTVETSKGTTEYETEFTEWRVVTRCGSRMSMSAKLAPGIELAFQRDYRDGGGCGEDSFDDQIVFQADTPGELEIPLECDRSSPASQ